MRSLSGSAGLGAVRCAALPFPCCLGMLQLCDSNKQLEDNCPEHYSGYAACSRRHPDARRGRPASAARLGSECLVITPRLLCTETTASRAAARPKARQGSAACLPARPSPAVPAAALGTAWHGVACRALRGRRWGTRSHDTAGHARPPDGQSRTPLGLPVRASRRFVTPTKLISEPRWPGWGPAPPGLTALGGGGGEASNYSKGGRSRVKEPTFHSSYMQH